MELYIIRHAQSSNNALADARTRVHDPLLTKLGQQQAQVLARRLAFKADSGTILWTPGSYNQWGFGLTHLYCSPMRRSLQTAQPIAEALGITPEIWVDIHEQGGIYLDQETGNAIGLPGISRSEVLAEFPGYQMPEELTEQGWWTGTYEEMVGCFARAARVAARLRQWAASAERIAVVSHGAFIDALLKNLFNQSPDSRHWHLHHNTAISRIDFRTDGSLDVIYLDRVDHLPTELIS